VDGTNASLLCEFLSKVLTICNVSQIAVPTIYEYLYPYCRAELWNWLKEAVVLREGFD
jgi:hypothetical protein